VNVKRLEGLPLFSGLSRHDREQVARWADEVDVEAGYHLLDQGRLPYEFFVIEEGTVEVRKDGELLSTLGPGDFLGEIAILEHGRRTATVVAVTRVRAVVMHSRDFGAMNAEMPAVAETLRATVRERLGR
jgi:CRP-like cAMP-binding protein